MLKYVDNEIEKSYKENSKLLDDLKKNHSSEQNRIVEEKENIINNLSNKIETLRNVRKFFNKSFDNK